MALEFEKMIRRPITFDVVEVTKENAVEIINASGMFGSITAEYDLEDRRTEWYLALKDDDRITRVIVNYGDYLARGENLVWFAILKDEIHKYIPYNGTDHS